MPERKPFLLRLAPDMHEALARWAADELRSLNGQIEFLLREALRRAGRLPAPSRPGGAEPGKRQRPG
ncbi:MAG: toxin-antitoxin system HicB family antitoxin [Deltaproteobacteria bacterium]|nr:toxin-antitoxin system HicB family antitoxin [Deltaproteobacteria bacterium]